jgi:hypothetical protein
MNSFKIFLIYKLFYSDNRAEIEAGEFIIFNLLIREMERIFGSSSLKNNEKEL